MPISQVINPMVNPPSISDPANFEAEAEAFLNTALQTRANEMNAFAAQANALSTEVNSLASAMTLNSTNDTSVTSNLIAVGSKTFTVSASKSYVKGMYVVIADTTAPSTNSMFGIVDSYSGTTLVVSVLSIRGTGTKTAWTISQSAAGVTAETYTRTNILGTVSQSGGVPTGALIEYGVNANGEYWKCASGNLICYRVANIAGNTTAFQPFAFPTAFVNVPAISISYAVSPTAGTVVDWYNLCAASSVHTEGAEGFYLLYRGASLASNGLVYISAVGRWF